MSPKSGEGEQLLRLLGLAFAGADLVFEIDEQGRIGFALGAAEGMTGRSDRALVGESWATLVSEDEADLLATLLAGVKPGERFGPARVALAGPKRRLTRHANLSVFRMPQRGGRLSCALSVGGPEPVEVARTSEGFITGDSFGEAATHLIADAERAGVNVRLDLVELEGLSQMVQGLAPEDALIARRKLAATLRSESYGGSGASEVAPDRFALVRNAASSGERLAETLQQATGLDIAPKVAELPIEPGGTGLNAKAVRYALDRFIEDGPDAAAQGFMGAVKRMVRDTTRFKTVLADGTFQLVYQPVVGLGDRKLHHYEALARFGGEESPADTIRMAEELDMIVDFDLAVAEAVVGVLAKAPPDLKVAVNVSAVSLMEPRFIQALITATSQAASARPRLLFEVTETRRLEDLDKAARIIDDLRGLGHPVCLDDFGAGAASLDYLRRLTVDFLKIDGRFVQALKADSREALILKHIAGLCADMKTVAIAEMIETEATARLAEALGVGLGQGWAFGKPAAEPNYTNPGPLPVRRVGVVKEWC